MKKKLIMVSLFPKKTPLLLLLIVLSSCASLYYDEENSGVVDYNDIPDEDAAYFLIRTNYGGMSNSKSIIILWGEEDKVPIRIADRSGFKLIKVKPGFYKFSFNIIGNFDVDNKSFDQVYSPLGGNPYAPFPVEANNVYYLGRWYFYRFGTIFRNYTDYVAFYPNFTDLQVNLAYGLKIPDSSN